jgi:hypothetical protein
MNWYKKAQQQDFPFYNDENTIEDSPNLFHSNQSKETLEELMNSPDAVSFLTITSLLQKFKYKYNIITLPNEEQLITVDIGNDKYVIDDVKYPSVKEAHQWLWDVSNYGRINNYMPSEDFSKTFWNDVGNGYVLYHATPKDNIESIKKNGIMIADKTRGVSNRSTGAAVFTSENPDDIIDYGNTIFQINISQMKQDGYTPDVSREEPLEEAELLEALAGKIGIEEFNATVESGLYSSTVIIYGNIPPKYISLYNSNRGEG